MPSRLSLPQPPSRPPRGGSTASDAGGTADTAAAPHEVVWNRAKVARFWDYMASRTGDDYFSRQVGDHLIRLTQRKIGPLRGRVLDFGCGPGYLLEKLAARKIACEGVDLSSDSVAAVAGRLAGNRYFTGAAQIDGIPTSLPGDAFGVVFFVETLEHVVAQDILDTLAELFRIVRPGGHVVVTTPHDERLDSRKVLCPDCACVFHRVQHVSSWTVDSLSSVMAEVGFQSRLVKPTLFTRQQLLWKLGVRAKYLVLRSRPHLLYIGQKPVAGGAA